MFIPDSHAVIGLFPDLAPLMDQQDPPWTIHMSMIDAVPVTVTCSRLHLANDVWYADAIHIGLYGVGATRMRWHGSGSQGQPLWTYEGDDLTEAVKLVLTPPDTVDW